MCTRNFPILLPSLCHVSPLPLNSSKSSFFSSKYIHIHEGETTSTPDISSFRPKMERETERERKKRRADSGRVGWLKSVRLAIRFRKKVVETGAVRKEEEGGRGVRHKRVVLQVPANTGLSRDNVTRRLLEIVWSIYPTVKYT